MDGSYSTSIMNSARERPVSPLQKRKNDLSGDFEKELAQSAMHLETDTDFSVSMKSGRMPNSMP